MAVPTDVVVAGTKAFALALFAPLTERMGTRPRIAPEPQQALTLCAGSSGVLVVEYGAAWLAVLQQLRRQAPGLRVVAALPRGEEAAALTLAPLGVEAVPWDGQPAPVLVAVSGLLGGAPPPSPAGLEPSAPRPAPPPATTPAAGTPAQPPRPSPPVRAAAPAGPPVAPVAQPARAAAAAAGSLSDDLFSGLEPIESAVAAPAASSAATAPERAAPPPYTGPAAASATPSGGADWPADAPTEDEAESALVLHARGKLRPEAPLAALTGQAVAAMSELERQVLGGATLPFDTQPVYRAAVLRLRVAVALSTAPTTPARVDDAAVQQLLAEFDALLAQVNPLAQSAPPEHQGALEAVRNALVREAVDFSEATHRVTAGGPPPPEASPRPAPRGPAVGARVISVQAGEAREAPEERRRRGPVILLAIVVLLGAGYHAWNYLAAPAPVLPVTYQGAPAGTRAVTTAGGRFLLALAGQRVDPAALERFRRQEEKKGNTVREVSPGRWIIEPAVPAAKERTP